MRLIFNILFISSMSFFNVGKANLMGKYCANIFGNELNISVNGNKSNISANIFGESLSCNDERFTFNNNSLLFSQNKSDCLNKHLKDMGACPCPPDVKYDPKKNFLDILGTSVGELQLKHCD